MILELAELYGETSILTVAKEGRIRWLRHVMRMPDSYSIKKGFDPQFGIRRRGAQRTRWLDQAKRDLSEIRCFHGWEAAARVRASWRMIDDRAIFRFRSKIGLVWIRHQFQDRYGLSVKSRISFGSIFIDWCGSSISSVLVPEPLWVQYFS